MKTILIDPLYNPNNQVDITSATKLAAGMPVASFLGSTGNRTNFDYTGDVNQRKAIARQLYLHANLFGGFNSHPAFLDTRLVIIEAITSEGTDELKKSGQKVTYALINNSGEIDQTKTFDLAVFWKDHLDYDELILWYDTFNPDGSITVQLILTLPVITETFNYSTVPAKKLATWYNGNVTSTDELVEILE